MICKFCHGVIDDDVTKCVHCGSWVNAKKSNSISFFKKHKKKILVVIGILVFTNLAWFFYLKGSVNIVKNSTLEITHGRTINEFIQTFARQGKVVWKNCDTSLRQFDDGRKHLISAYFSVMIDTPMLEKNIGSEYIIVHIDFLVNNTNSDFSVDGGSVDTSDSQKIDLTGQEALNLLTNLYNWKKNYARDNN